MGLLRSQSALGAQNKKSSGVLRKDSAVAERSANTSAQESQRQKSVSSQDRPKTAHSQPERPKTADRHPDRPKTADRHHERPKTAERQQTVDRRRSFSRPRTANSAGSAPRNIDTDQEREEVEMAMPVQTIEFKAGKDTYNFPTPSPRLPPPRCESLKGTSPSRSPLGAPVDDSPKIGMAVGSPRDMPPQWGRSHTHDPVAKKLPARPPPARAMTEVADVPEKTVDKTPKKKTSWKNLGGIFARKPSTKTPSQQPVQNLQPPQEQEEPALARTLHTAPKPHASSPTQPSGGHPSQTASASGHRRTPSNSMPRGMARLEARAQADRAAFMENEEKGKDQAKLGRKVRTPSMIQKEGFSPTFGSPNAQRTSEEMFKSMDGTAKRNDSPPSLTDPSGPLRLDLDIPDHHMERYSIMFEKFLSSSGERRPSIIERRQSKLQRKRSLKRLDDVNGKEHTEAPTVPQRSASSPHMSKMPPLSIKTGKKVRSPKASPSAREDPPVTAVRHPKPVKRSNTAPTKATSPVKQNFSKPRMVVVPEPMTESPEAMSHPRGLSVYSEDSLPLTPASDIGPLPAAEPHMNPLRSNPSNPCIAASTDTSGTWDMLNANPNTPAIPQRRVSLARREPPDHNLYHRVKSPEDLESRVVQVSVARQVSVSKARKQVRQAVDAKQPLRPRVVELSKNRKSTMVLIEGGEE